MTSTSEAETSARRPAVITGAGRNIGAHLARALARDGHPVALCARRPDEIEVVAADIAASGGRALAITADVTELGDVERLVSQATSTFGTAPAILVNNAVVRLQKPLEDMSLEDFKSVLDVVLTGAFATVKCALPGMRERGWGRIVNMSGVAGESGAVNRAGLVTAKSGIIGLTKAVALEAARDGITANAISPGIIDTHRDERQMSSMGDERLAARHYAEETERIPVGRRGEIEEVSAACRYLVSDQAGFVTGQVLRVNGGRYM